MSPKISVVMPVFNAAPFLKEAIDSVLGQTYRDFELILIDDGSTDGSAELLRLLDDERIRLVVNDANRGLIFSLNRGLDMARGQYIARMDADDVSLRHRFAAQVAFLDGNPAVDVCGTWFRTIGLHERVHRHPEAHEEIMEQLLHVGCVIGHPTVMFRRAALAGLRYEPAYQHAEDYRLWALMSRTSKFANLPEVLLLYRTHAAQASESHAAAQQLAAARIQASIAAFVVPELSAEDLRWLERAFSGEGGFAESELLSIRRVLSQLVDANAKGKRFRRRPYDRLLARVWFRSCLQYTFDHKLGFRVFWTAPIGLLRGWPALLPMICKVLARRSRAAGRGWANRLWPFDGIAVRLSGDLANQMFQYATAFAVSEKCMLKLGIDTSDFSLFPRHQYRLGGWALDGRMLAGGIRQLGNDCHVVHERDSASLHPAAGVQDGKGVYLVGEWRKHERFAESRERLRGQFRPAGRIERERLDVIEQFRARASVAVLMCPAPFVVGGSVQRSSWPTAADAGYYARAISSIASSEPGLQVALFAVRRGTFALPTIPGFEQSTIGNIDDQSPEDLHMLSHAKHFVIPATAFGWWVAWLGNSPGKRVIAPSQWRMLHRSGDPISIPSEWERL